MGISLAGPDAESVAKDMDPVGATSAAPCRVVSDDAFARLGRKLWGIVR